MAITKSKALDIVILLILGIFPLGQLPGILLGELIGVSFRVQPIDFLVFAACLLMLKASALRKLRIFVPLFVVSIFSLILSLFGENFDFLGVLYYLRIIVYVCFGVFFAHLKVREDDRSNIIVWLIYVGIIVAAYGFLQYFFFPDLRSMKLFGWDDHYFRLTSTFLDPAFTGIILALAALAAVANYLKEKNKIYVFTIIFLLASLGLTYSRASFLSLAVGLTILLWRKYKLALVLCAALFILTFPLLPREAGGEGVKLLRTSSALLKVENYKESLQIISHSPVFGVGYNNICKTKRSLNFDTSQAENSCYGLDNSYLLVLASTGIVGLISFVNTGLMFVKRIVGVNKSLVVASTTAVLVHALFTNTLFYPWVMLWLFLLYAASIEKK